MFKSGSPVKGKAFIDRKKHLPLFKSYLSNNQHIMIKAPRRFGKTSLIKHIFEYEKSYEFIYVDVRLATSLKSLSNQLIDKAYALVKIDNFIRQTKDSLYKLLQSIKQIKVSDVAEVSIEYVTKESDEMEYFIHSLDVIQKIAASKGANVKLIFDEFQDITKLGDKNILEVLRSVAQHHENITYVFLGSIETIMTKIFESKTSPFFHFASVIQLDGLDIDELYEYTKEVFEKENIVFDEAALKKTILFLDGHPEYSVKVLQTLYIRASLEKIKIDSNACMEAISFRVIENRAYLDELINKTKTKKHHFEVMHNIANGIASNLPSATLYNTHVSLEEMGLIKKVAKGEYALVDIFLKILLQQKDDEMLSIENRLEIFIL